MNQEMTPKEATRNFLAGIASTVDQTIYNREEERKRYGYAVALHSHQIRPTAEPMSYYEYRKVLPWFGRGDYQDYLDSYIKACEDEVKNGPADSWERMTEEAARKHVAWWLMDELDYDKEEAYQGLSIFDANEEVGVWIFTLGSLSISVAKVRQVYQPVETYTAYQFAVNLVT